MAGRKRTSKAPARAKKKSSGPKKPPAPPERREVVAVVLLALGLILGLSLLSFHPRDALFLAGGEAARHNLVGLVGHRLADGLLDLMGLGSFVVALALVGAAGLFFARRPVHVTLVEGLGGLLAMLAGSVLAHLALSDARPLHHAPGGLVGHLGGELLRGQLNTVGAVIVAGAVLVLALLLATDFTVARLAAAGGRAASALTASAAAFARARWLRYRAARALRAEARARRRKEREAERPPPLEADDRGIVTPPAAQIAPRDDVEAELCDVVPSDPLEDPNHMDPAWAPGLARLGGEGGLPVVVGGAPVIEVETKPELEEDEHETNEVEHEHEHEAEHEPLAVTPGEHLPTIVAAKSPPKPRRKKRQDAFAFTTHGERFHLPELELLDEVPPEHQAKVDAATLHDTAKKLTQKLADFGITGEVQKIRLGPVVTMYEFVPGPGVKISKISGLADDLAMAMEALRVRIVAPLPGKGAVGIEVPNKERQTVYLKEILEQETFANARSKLTLGMGKDVEGMPFVVDLAKMPHLLIAGTTGSGKSVSVNAMIASILYKATPDEVRFIMVDPKWTELSLYEGIPHLLLPVVKDPAKAAMALRWAVDEMERRYQLLAEIGVRGLAGFNREVEKRRIEWEHRESERPPLPPLESVEGDAEAYETLKRAHEERHLADPPPPEKLPLIVIIIDELADLMMVASREVETYIARIAQKARAAGIHLLVATQRPSTDVITGLIKVNFPVRIGFRVASRHDSQTIINQPGSEKLLGQGDMLIIPPGQSDPVRVHGAFVSDDEIKRLVDHLETQGEPIYDQSILKPREDELGEDEEAEEYDPKWDEAVLVVSERESISVSMIQRKLKIGYNRAARMIERMEREGIVGPADGSKPRDVLVSAPPPATMAAP